MDLNKYTQSAQQAIIQSQQIARDQSHQIIEPAHILLALLQQPEGIAPAVITRISGDVNALINELKKDLDARPKITGAVGEVGLSSQAAEVLNAAERFAKGMTDEFEEAEDNILL